MNNPLLGTALRSIAETLAVAAGVDSHTVDNRLHWIVNMRCRILGLADAVHYAERLHSDPREVEALVDAVIVPETRFFRDMAVFDHLRKWVPQIAAEFPGELRVLSAPCSTGQEPYSVAAIFQVAGIPLDRFTVRAVDLSGAAIDTARKGVYPIDAVRHLPADRQYILGEADGAHWLVHRDLKRRVQFERLNLAEPNALEDRTYHLILCRNLFIYLSKDARRSLAESLAKALLPGGRLILGTADHVEELNTFFAPVKPAASFAFVHRKARAEDVPAVSSKAAASLIQLRARRSIPQAQEPESAKPSEPDAAALFRSALQHQQHGEFAKAEYRCRQTLYLDPGYLPALELLEVLWLNLPDQRLRRALSARIGRNRRSTQKDTAALEGTT